MTTVKDADNREWTINVNILTVKRLRELKEDPISLTDPQQLGGLFDDVGRQYEVTWQIVKEQAATHSIDEMAFAEIWTKNFAKFTDALVDALKNFFQLCGKQELSGIIEKTLSVSKQIQSVVSDSVSGAKMDQYVSKIVRDEQNRIDKAFEKALKEDPETTETNTTLSGGSPES